MSALVFSGAAQFAALEFWPNPTALFSVLLVAFAINARHIIIGAALSPWLNKLPLCKMLLTLSLLSDANFADSQPAFQSGERDAGTLLGGGLILWLNWVSGTAIGAMAGHTIGDLQAFGLDVVMVCFFAGTIALRLKDRSDIFPAGVASAVAVLTMGLVPAGWNIILGALAGGLWGAFADEQ